MLQDACRNCSQPHFRLLVGEIDETHACGYNLALDLGVSLRETFFAN